MLSRTLLSATLVAAFSTPVLAEEIPAYDAQLQAQIIGHLQTKLPQMRSGYGLTQEANIRTEEREARKSWMSRISVDGIRSYTGRIVWL